MKHHILLCCAVAGLATFAAPLPCSTGNWNLNPLTCRADAAARTIRVNGRSGLAVYDAPRSANMRLSARVTPERTGTNGWSVIGVAFADDDRNYWHAALVQAPPDQAGGKRTFELCEMRDGHWLAQFADRLVCTRLRQTRTWNYGETYEIAIESTTAGIAGRVKDARGETIWEAAYAYPKPAADGSVAAVTCGRPALHANGGFRGLFAAPDADWSEARPLPASQTAVPAYASESFVPGVTDAATGFFRVVQKDGRWWVIDPLGRGTVLLGVDHVTYWGHYSQRTKRSIHHEVNKARFPNKGDWEEDTLRRLKAWGFNLLGAGCDRNLKHRGLIHTIFLSIGDELCREGSDADLYICPNEHRPCSAFPNVFHPDFAAWADYRARQQCAPNKDDPWLFGYFIDNELSWWGRAAPDTGLYDAVAKLPETHSAKVAQRKFLASRGVTGAPSDAVKLDFLKLAADIYFRVSSEAIRRHDPNHLVMGARFAGLGGAHPAVWEVSGKYCDVVTFNCYPWADLDRNVVLTDRGGRAKRITEAFAEQYDYVKRPMLITEWSFPALDSGLPCTGGAGQRFQTQALRTQATELFAKTMLSLPFLVGYDYFMWVDEPAAGISDAFPEDSNYGLINEQGEAYPEITAMFAKLHRSLGAVRAAGTPPERPAAKFADGVTSGEFAARFPASSFARGQVVYTRTGDSYVIRNAAGLELAGRVGGPLMFETVKLNGTLLGQYTGMWNDRVAGALGWHNAGSVVSAEWREEAGRGVLYVTCEGWSRKDRGMAETHAITVFADKPWFLCDFVSARNVGCEPIEINAFYFRQYAPFAADKADAQMKSVPNLWKAPARDAWISAKDGAYYGGVSFAPTVGMFIYHLMNNGKSSHPDAMFIPQDDLVMQPGAVYAPQGKMWMLALCGFGGAEGWKKVSEGLESPDSGR